MTELETKLITLIAEDLYTPVNGAEPKEYEDCGVIWWWPDEVAADMGINEHALGGVAASLIEKGLIGIFKDNGPDDDTVWLTEAGFAEYRKTKGGK